MIDIKEILRKKILNNEYCKFDLVKELFTEEELLHDKSCILRDKLAAELGIDVTAIKEIAFNQWRRRIRRHNSSLSNSSGRSSHSNYKPNTKPIVEEPTRSNKENIEDLIKPVTKESLQNNRF